MIFGRSSNATILDLFVQFEILLISCFEFEVLHDFLFMQIVKFGNFCKANKWNLASQKSH